jgi:hypothetical protein
MVAWAGKRLAAIEDGVHGFLRGGPQKIRPRAVALGLLVIVAFFACLPLVITRSTSFSEAGAICRGRRSQLSKVPDATSTLFPLHWWNLMAMVNSLICGFVWLYCSPHRLSHREHILDKTREWCETDLKKEGGGGGGGGGGWHKQKKVSGGVTQGGGGGG